MERGREMASTGQTSPAFSPPVVIVVCIVGAVIIIVIVAAVYRLCRRATVAMTADEEMEADRWNPNKRSKEQDEYMERVRWRNNMFAWDRAQLAKLENDSTSGEEYRRGMLRQRYEARRAQEQGTWIGVSTHCDVDGAKDPYNNHEITAEEFLAVENPYRGMLYASPPLRSPRCTEEHRPRINLNQVSQDDNLTGRYCEEGFEEVSLAKPPVTRNNNITGVKITMNDDSDDIVDNGMLETNNWAPQQSRMFRSSSIYSGDVLLPSTHLHLVQSSSNYALRNDKRLSRAQQNIEEWEHRNRR